MFGKLEKHLTPTEKARLEQLNKQWAEQEKQTKIAEYNVKVLEKQNEKREREQPALLKNMISSRRNPLALPKSEMPSWSKTLSWRLRKKKLPILLLQVL